MRNATARRFDIDARELQQRYGRQVRSFLRKRCDGKNIPAYHVDDLAQEVWIRVCARYGMPDHVDSIIGYLMRTASNCVSELAQRSRLRREHVSIDDVPEDVEQFIDYSCDPEQQMCAEQRSEYIRRVFAEVLTHRQRDIFMLHLGGMTNKAIADARGLTYRIVIRDMTRAYARLRLVLRDDLVYMDLPQEVPTDFPCRLEELNTKNLLRTYRISAGILERWRAWRHALLRSGCGQIKEKRQHGA